MLSEQISEYVAISRAPALDLGALAVRGAALLESALAAERDAQERVLEALAEDVARAGGSLVTSARLAGALVEQGAWSERLVEALTRPLGSWVESALGSLELALARRNHELDAELGEAEAAELDAELRRDPSATGWRLLHELHPALLSVLGASSEERRRLAELGPRLILLEPWHAGASWLRRTLAVLDDEPLSVLHVPSGRAFTCRMSGLLTNADLFVMLADALAGAPSEGWLSHERPPTAAVACLRGDGPQESGVSLECPWNVYTLEALGPDHRLPEPGDYAAAPLWVWPEGEPCEIPALDGARILLLGPPGYARVIAVERAVCTLRGSLEARPLSSDETKALLERISLSSSGSARSRPGRCG